MQAVSRSTRDASNRDSKAKSGLHSFMQGDKPKAIEQDASSLALFHPAVRQWFAGVFAAPTRPQTMGWPAIARGESTLILAPTGTGKTLAAFLWCLDRLMLHPGESFIEGCRVIYI